MADMSDVTHIQDEDLLRRMWQQTEDFARKKEIRARMYKLREQRLRDFYTTGEVLRDVLSTTSLDDGDGRGGGFRSTGSASDLIESVTGSNNSNSQRQVVTKTSSYVTSGMTHADSLADEGFLTLKSKEIRDSESPTREWVRQERNSALNRSGDDGSTGYWRVVQDSSNEQYSSSSRTGPDGETVVHSTSQSERRNMAADSESDGVKTQLQTASSENTTRVPKGENNALKNDSDGVMVIRSGDGGTVIQSSSSTTGGSRSQRWASSSSSSRMSSSSSSQQMSSSSTSANRSSTIRDGDSRNMITTTLEKDIQSSVPLEGIMKTSLIRDLDTGDETRGSTTIEIIRDGGGNSRNSSETRQTSSSSISRGSSQNVTKRSQMSDTRGGTVTTEFTTSSKPIHKVEYITTTTGGDTNNRDYVVDVTIGGNTTVTQQTHGEKQSATSNTSNNRVVEQKIMTELHKLDSFLSQHPGGDSTPVTPATPATPATGDTRDGGSWTVVSSTQQQVDKRRVDGDTVSREFVFRSGNDDSTSCQNESFIQQERVATMTSRVEDTTDHGGRDGATFTITVVKQEPGEKPESQSKQPQEGAPKLSQPDRRSPAPSQDAPRPCAPKEKEPTAPRDVPDGEYITTYQTHYTPKRISVDVSPTHNAFVSSLRASPERCTPPSSTRSSSKTSLDRASPTRFNKQYRNRTSLDNSLSSLGRVSPDKSIRRTSPVDGGRRSPEKAPRTSPEKTIPGGRTSPDKTYHSPGRVSPDKGRTSPDKSYQSPGRTSPDKPIQSPGRTSPDKAYQSPGRTSPSKTNQSPGRTSPTKSFQSPGRTSPTKPYQSPGRTSPTKPYQSPGRTSPTKPLQSLSKTSPDGTVPDRRRPSTDRVTSITKVTTTRRVSSGDKPKDSIPSSPARKTSDTGSPSRKKSDTFSPVRRPSADTPTRNHVTSTVVTVGRTTKDKRRLSSGATRTATKKRSSTPGTSPGGSPPRDDEPKDNEPGENKPHTERQSRPRSRGSSRGSSTTTSDTEVVDEVTTVTVKDTDGITKITKSIDDSDKITTVTRRDSTKVTRTDEDILNTTLVSRTDVTITDKSVTDLKKRVTQDLLDSERGVPPKSEPEDKTPTGRRTSSDRPSTTITTTSRKVSEDKKTTSSIIRKPEEPTPKRKDSKPEPTNTSPGGRTPSPTKPQRESPRSPSSPQRAPRDRSPEYSSEGSLACEFPRRPATDSPGVPQQPETTRPDSPGSSPERARFSPIKCFRTSPDAPAPLPQPQKPAPANAPVTAPGTERREPIKPSKPISSRPTDTDDSDAPDAPDTRKAPSPSRLPVQTKITRTDEEIRNLSLVSRSDIAITDETTTVDTTTDQRKRVTQEFLETERTRPEEDTPEDKTPTRKDSRPQTLAFGKPKTEQPEDFPSSPTKPVGKPLPSQKRRDDESSEDDDQLQPEKVPEKPDPQSSSISPCSSPERPSVVSTTQITLTTRKTSNTQESGKPQKPQTKTEVPRKIPGSPTKSPQHSMSPKGSIPRPDSGRPTDDGESHSPSRRAPVSPQRGSPQRSPSPKKPERDSTSPQRSPTDRSPAPGSPSRSPVRSPDRAPLQPKKTSPTTRSSNIPRAGQKPSAQGQADDEAPRRPVHSIVNVFETKKRTQQTTAISRIPHSPGRSPSKTTPTRKAPETQENGPQCRRTPEAPRIPQKPKKPQQTQDHPQRRPGSASPTRPRTSGDSSPERRSPCNSPERPRAPTTPSSRTPVRPTSRLPQKSPTTSSPDRQQPRKPVVNGYDRLAKSPAGPRYPCEEPKSAFVRTGRRPEESPERKAPKRAPTSGKPTQQPGRPGRPDDRDEEPTTDRSSTVSSPETVKTAGEITNFVVDAAYIVNTVTGQVMDSEKITTRKRTDVFVPQLSGEQPDSSPSEDDEDTPEGISRKNLPPQHAPVSITITTVSNKRMRDDEDFYNEDYIECIQDETPPDTFLVDDEEDEEEPERAPKTAPKSGPLRKTQPTRAPTTKTTRVPTRPSEPTESPTNRKPDSRTTNDRRAPSAPTTRSTPHYAAPVRREPQQIRQPTGQSPARQPAGHSPARQPVGKSPARIPFGQTPSRTPTGPSPARTPVGQSPARTPVRQSPARQPTAQSPARGPTSRPTTRVVTETRITRSNSDKNVIRRQPTSQSPAQPRRQVSKPEISVTRAVDKKTNTTATSRTTSVRQTTASTTCRTTSTTANNRTTKAIQKKPGPRDEPENRRKPRPDTITTTRRTTVTSQKRTDVRKGAPVNQPEPTDEEPYTSSSEDEPEEVPDATTDEGRPSPLVYTDTDGNESELDIIRRRTDDVDYEQRLRATTTREDHLLSATSRTSHMSVTLQQTTKSSRESSPDYLRRPQPVTDTSDDDSSRPRYADRVSEPDDEDDITRRRTSPARPFQRPVVEEEPLEEEQTDEEPGHPKPQQPDQLRPQHAKPEQPVQQKPLQPTQQKPQPQQPRTDVIRRTELVTDLDESDTEDITRVNVSVADRVSLFLEESRRVSAPYQPTQPSQPEEQAPGPLDSPSSVRRAKAMFESIATSPKASPTLPRKKIDIYDTTREEPKKQPVSQQPAKEQPHEPYCREYPSEDDEELRLEPDLVTGSPTRPVDRSPEREGPSSRETSPSPERPGNKYDTFTKPKTSPQQPGPKGQSPTRGDESPRRQSPTRRESLPKKPNETSSVRKESLPRKDFPSDTFPRKKSHDQSPDDREPVRKASLPKKEFPSDTFTRRKPSQDTFPEPKDTSPTRKESSPTRKDSFPTKDYPTGTYTRRKAPQEDYPADKDTSPARRPSQPGKDSPVDSPREQSPDGRRVSPTRRDSKPRSDYPSGTYTRPKESPQQPGDKDVSPTRKDSTPRRDYPSDTFTRRKPSKDEQDASPTRRTSQPRAPTDTFPRKKTPEDQEPSRPRKEIPANTVSARRAAFEKHASPASSPVPTRKDLTPKRDVPSGTFPRRKPEDQEPVKQIPRPQSPERAPRTREDSPEMRDHRQIDILTRPSVFEARRRVAPAPTTASAPTRRDSPERTSPDRGSPTRKEPRKPSVGGRESPVKRPESPRKEVTPTRKDSTPSRRESVPTRKDSVPKEASPTCTSPVRRESVPTRRDSFPTRKESIPESSPVRKESVPTRKESVPTRKESVPTRKDSVPKEASPVRKESIPSRKESVPSRKDSVPTRKDSLPKEASPTRRPGSPRKDTPAADTTRTGKFGVALRTVSSSQLQAQRRRSSDTVRVRDEELVIEEIFDLELLERLLEQAVGYEQRRSIRAQIRVVKRMISEQTITTTSSTTLTNSAVRSSTTTTSAEVNESHRSTRSSAVASITSQRRPESPEFGDSEPEEPRQPVARPPVVVQTQRKVPRVADEDDEPETERETKPVPGYQRPLNRHVDAPEEPSRTTPQRPSSRPSESPEREPGTKTVPGYLRPLNRQVDTPEEPSKPSYQRPRRPSVESPEREPVSRNVPGYQRPLNRQVEPEEPSRTTPHRTSGRPTESPEPSGRPVPSYQRPLNRQTESPEEPSRTSPVGRGPRRGESPDGTPSYQRPLNRAPDSPDRRTSPTRKPSKSEMTVELRPASSPVKSSPATKKTSTGEAPREACPTDCVTSSYGVGPTDEHGRPLFGLKALRRQNTSTNNQAPSDLVDTPESAPAPARSPAAASRAPAPSSPAAKAPSDIRDSSGRPLFGGLRALKASAPRPVAPRDDDDDGLDGPDGPDGPDDMPEQPSSPQLKELVSRHEQHVRGNSVSEPVAPRQKPRARLRDSFLNRSQERDTPDDEPEPQHPEDARLLAQRACTLKSIIQKHEKLVTSATETDRLNRKPQEEPETRDSTSPEPSRRPGILKKPRDDQVDEVTSTSKTTVVTSRGHLRSDGTVSLTRDVIKGERVCRPGEEPVTKVTKTHYSYTTPEEKTTLSIEPYEDEDEDEEKPLPSPQSSRKSSVAKSSSPERSVVDNIEDEVVKSSKVTSLIRDNSVKKFKVVDDDTSKSTPISKTQITVRPGKLSVDDDANSVRRRSKLFEEKIDSHKTQTSNKFTSGKVTDNQKFVSSVGSKKTAEPSKPTQTSKGSRSPTRSISPEKNIPDHAEKEPSRTSNKYTTSRVTSVTQKTGSRTSPSEKTPDSVRRKIFANEDDSDEYEVSNQSSYSQSSQFSQSTTQVVSRKTASYETAALEERRYSRDREALEDRRFSPDRKVSSLEYDDEDEDDEGYNMSGQYVSSSSTKHTIRTSPERINYEKDDTESQTRGSKYSVSKSQHRSTSTTGGTTVTTTETSSTNVSRSSTPSTTGRRRSSATLDDREGSPTPSGLSRGARGGSVRALSQKFQQAAATSKVKQSVSTEVKTGSSPASAQSTPRAEQESKTFLNSQTKVTGVQDIISRMRNADQDTQDGDTEEDAEARSLLNKFLGAQVILQGMEPLMKDVGDTQSQSAVLVSQVERQRVLKSQKVTSSSASNGVIPDVDIEEIWDEELLKQLLESCSDYEGRRKIRARLRTVMAEQTACASVVAAARADEEAAAARRGSGTGASSFVTHEETERGPDGSTVHRTIQQGHAESTMSSSSVDGNTVTKTEVTTKSSSFSATSMGKSQMTKVGPPKPMSPFAKFQQLDRQNSPTSPNSPKTPGGSTAAPLFKFTDPKLSRSASGVTDRLLFWCQCKTKDYKNIQIGNFSTCWSNGLAFCALIHHFLPDAFDYDSLRPEERRKNFELAFRVADEKAGIAPLLDVEDMVMMRKPDWKCVFTYVQSIYRRFKDED